MLRISSTKLWSVKYAKTMAIPPELQQVINGALIELQYMFENKNTGWSRAYQFTNPYNNQLEYIVFSVDNNEEQLGLHQNKFKMPGNMRREIDEELNQGQPTFHKITLSYPREDWIPYLARGILEHETIHAIDPKIGRNLQDKSKGTYYVNSTEDYQGYAKTPHEFDAYSTEIIYQLQRLLNINYLPIEEVYSWLKGAEMPEKWKQGYYAAEDFWNTISSEPTLAKRFKQRVYQALEEWKNNPTVQHERVQNDPQFNAKFDEYNKWQAYMNDRSEAPNPENLDPSDEVYQKRVLEHNKQRQQQFGISPDSRMRRVVPSQAT